MNILQFDPLFCKELIKFFYTIFYMLIYKLLFMNNLFDKYSNIVKSKYMIFVFAIAFLS